MCCQPLSHWSLHLGTSGPAICIITEIRHPQKHTKHPVFKLQPLSPGKTSSLCEVCHCADPGGLGAALTQAQGVDVSVGGAW